MGADSISLTDDISTSVDDGYIDMMLRTLRVLDVDGQDVSDDFAIVPSSIQGDISTIPTGEWA